MNENENMNKDSDKAASEPAVTGTAPEPAVAPAASKPTAPKPAASKPVASKPAVAEAAPKKQSGKHRTLLGRVVSDSMNKTIAVLVERRVRHPLYAKYIRRSRRMLAHDEDNTSHVGDTVIIEECRHMAKRKSWKLAQILRKAAKAEIVETVQTGKTGTPAATGEQA